MYHDLVRSTGALKQQFTRAGSDRFKKAAGYRPIWGGEDIFLGYVTSRAEDLRA